MLTALQNGIKVLAQKGQHAICPECGTEVLAKCGDINIWHWAHVSLVNCDLWGEPESAWHLHWKSGLPLDWVEVPMTHDDEKHRADIRLPNGRVVELQHSSISISEIAKREQFYRKMVWIFDVQEAANAIVQSWWMPAHEEVDSDLDDNAFDSEAGIFQSEDENDESGYEGIEENEQEGILHCVYRLHLRARDNTNYRTFRWRHAKKHIAYCIKPVFLDLGNDQILYLKKMYPESPVGGWGLIYPKSKLVNQIATGQL